MSAYTPGPWSIPNTPGSLGGIAHATGYVAFTATPRKVSDERLDGESWLDMRNRTEAERESVKLEELANARLIAAAPTMHEEMQRFLEVIERAEADSEVWTRLTAGTGIATANAYRAAIAKATGGADGR